MYSTNEAHFQCKWVCAVRARQIIHTNEWVRSRHIISTNEDVQVRHIINTNKDAQYKRSTSSVSEKGSTTQRYFWVKPQQFLSIRRGNSINLCLTIQISREFNNLIGCEAVNTSTHAPTYGCITSWLGEEIKMVKISLGMGYSRKYPHTPHGRLWKSCNKYSVSLMGIPWISPKFCEFWPEFQENHSKSCKIQEFPKILNQQGLESCINCYCPSWKSWNFRVPNSVSSIGGVDIFWNSPVKYSFWERAQGW